MRNLFFLFLVFVVVSCSKLLNEPKVLTPKDKMSEIIADLAIGDQLSYVDNVENMEVQTRYVLKKHKTTGADFTESYKYYLSTNDLENIFNGAQVIIKKKDPQAESYIDNKLRKQPKNVPPFAK